MLQNEISVRSSRRLCTRIIARWLRWMQKKLLVVTNKMWKCVPEFWHRNVAAAAWGSMVVLNNTDVNESNFQWKNIIDDNTWSILKMADLWDVVLCSLVDIDWHFRGADCPIGNYYCCGVLWILAHEKRSWCWQLWWQCIVPFQRVVPSQFCSDDFYLFCGWRPVFRGCKGTASQVVVNDLPEIFWIILPTLVEMCRLLVVCQI